VQQYTTSVKKYLKVVTSEGMHLVLLLKTSDDGAVRDAAHSSLVQRYKQYVMISDYRRTQDGQYIVADCPAAHPIVVKIEGATIAMMQQTDIPDKMFDQMLAHLPSSRPGTSQPIR
jgi:hypothetical protein